MNKKVYTTPTIIRIKMVMRESILSVCHNSPSDTPASLSRPCSIEQQCFEGGIHD